MYEKTLDLLELLREFPEAALTVHAGDPGEDASGEQIRANDL